MSKLHYEIYEFIENPRGAIWNKDEEQLTKAIFKSFESIEQAVDFINSNPDIFEGKLLTILPIIYVNGIKNKTVIKGDVVYAKEPKLDLPYFDAPKKFY